MADAVLTPSGGLIPAGTLVSAYYAYQKMLGRPPSGAVRATSTVSDQGTITFTGLLSGTAYTAYALVGDRHQYLDFETDPADDPGGTTDLTDVNNSIAALGTRVSALETGGPTFPDASTSQKGSTKLSSAPASAANPIAVGDNDSRMTQIADHETRILDLEGTGTPVTLGNDLVGGTSAALSINHASVILIDFPSVGTVDVQAYVAGDGGTGGTASLIPVTYDGVATDSALLDSGVAVGVNSGDAAGWKLLGSGLEVGEGIQAVGYLVGGTNGVATTRKNTGPAGSSYFNNDTYSDGPAATFGTAFADTAIHSIRVTFTPGNATAVALAALEGEITALEADVTALEAVDTATDARLDALEGGGSGGAGVTKSQVASFPFPASAVVESDPIEVPDGGLMVVAGAAGDQTITSVQVLDSLDGTTWRAHQSAATVVQRPYTKVRLTNGGTVQGDSELNMAIS